MTVRYVALLKGVNVGAARRIQMASLRDAFADQGFHDVRTYIQSGNVIFSAAEQDRALLAAAIEKALSESFAANIPVMIRTAADMASIVANNPFQEAASAVETSETGLVRLHVAFLAGEPGPGLAAHLDQAIGHGRSGENFALSGEVIYLYLPEGFHSSRLAQAVQKACPAATFRNWKTVVFLNQVLQS
jgi:uncharacterized protein (DUF1697 family)